MKVNTNCYGICLSIIVSLSLLITLPTQAQVTFPEGDGRAAVFIACTQCHGLDRLTRVTLNAMEWENAIYDMMARGAVVDVKDLDKVRDYLINNLAVDE